MLTATQLLRTARPLTCTCTCICEVIQPCSEESQEKGYSHIPHVLLFLTHKKSLHKFLICAMEITVPKLLYTASGIVHFRMYADGDGKGPDQTTNQGLLGCIWIFPQENNISIQAKSLWTSVLFTDSNGQQTNSKKYSNKPNIPWYFSRMGMFRKSRSQIPTCVIQSNLPHS